MTYKHLIYVFTTILVLSFLMRISTTSVTTAQNVTDLQLKISSDQKSYILGQPIKLDFLLKGADGEPFKLRTIPTVENGYLRVWISRSPEDFSEYIGPQWGLGEGNKLPQVLPAFRSSATILYNNKPPRFSSVPENRIQTEFAMPRAGIYFIKASAVIWNEKVTSDDDNVIIESDPIEVVIDEPLGNDKKIWNMIKDDGDLAYFMQQGDLRRQGYEERREKINKILNGASAGNGDSVLLNQLQSSMEKLRISETKIMQTRQHRQKH